MFFTSHSAPLSVTTAVQKATVLSQLPESTRIVVRLISAVRAPAGDSTLLPHL
jgi:hypothetical protein